MLSARRLLTEQAHGIRNDVMGGGRSVLVGGVAAWPRTSPDSGRERRRLVGQSARCKP